MRKILASMLTLGAVAAAVTWGTSSFFSDTEASNDNTFTAGAIDLKIDSEAHYNGLRCEENDSEIEDAPAYVWQIFDQAKFDQVNDDAYMQNLVGEACTGSWAFTDLGSEKFFNFTDIKPGDMGENTISMHVINNDAWACMNIGGLVDAENGLTEPEADVDQTLVAGELSESMMFFAWVDNGVEGIINSKGDNVYQVGERILYQPSLASSALNQAIALADSTTVGGPFIGSDDPEVANYVGLQWCAGTLSLNAGVLSCDGESMGNAAQTDGLTADLSFEVVQARNNPDFVCEAGTTVVVNSVGETATEDNWVFYNDENDTISSILGSFVSGPATPPAGAGSAELTVSGTQRRNLATFQFGGTVLSDITSMMFSTYQPSGQTDNERAMYLQFNVDFTGSGLWQSRLAFVPSQNGTVVQDAWQTWNAADDSALWWWSGYAGNGNKWPDNDTDEYRTWAELKTAFPGIRMNTGILSHLSFRAGEPYADGFTGNIDKFVIGINGANTVFDFEN